MFEPVAGKDGTVQIEWRGECDHTAEDRLAPPTTGAGRLAEAMTFLTDLLSGGPLPQRDIKVKAVSAGMAYRTVERAKEILGVISERQGWGPGSACYWKLSDNVGSSGGDHSTPSAPVALYVPDREKDEGEVVLSAEQALSCTNGVYPESPQQHSEGRATAGSRRDESDFYPPPAWVT
jgi:hypothetical protein